MKNFKDFNMCEKEVNQLLIEVYDHFGSGGFMKIAYIFDSCVDSFDFEIPTECKDECDNRHCCECWKNYVSTKFNR